MLSQDLENITRALELMVSQLPAEKASFLALACHNLHSLADRAQMLEDMPLDLMTDMAVPTMMAPAMIAPALVAPALVTPAMIATDSPLNLTSQAVSEKSTFH